MPTGQDTATVISYSTFVAKRNARMRSNRSVQQATAMQSFERDAWRLAQACWSRGAHLLDDAEFKDEFVRASLNALRAS